LEDPVSNCSIPYPDIKPFIVKYILKRWQDSWDQQIHSKLHEIHSLVGKTPCSYGQIRKEQVVLTRCCIGYGRVLNVSNIYIISGHDITELLTLALNTSQSINLNMIFKKTELTS
jgi:hypothetical protein